MSWDRIFRPNRYRIDDGIRRDPLSIGVWLAVNLGWSGTITAFGATLVGSLAIGAVGLGLSLLAGAVFSPTPNAPSPSERQATLRQSIGPRLRFYGTVNVGGSVAFFENTEGYLFQMATMNWGKISAVKELWLNDRSVVLDGAGYVFDGQYISEGRPAVQVFYKDGDPDQSAHDRLVTDFSNYVDSNFRFRNMANYLAIFHEVSQDEISRVYPQLNPSVRHVIDASLCERSREGTIGWSENNSDVIFDYLVGRDGAGFPWGFGYQKSQINIPSFQAFADLCDTDVPLKTGGSHNRYRLWGGYALNEEGRNVISRFAQTCDADLYLDTTGKIAIRGGQWVEPALTLDMDLGHIISADFRHGSGALAAFNELTITYTEPYLDYQEAECEPWIDGANVALRGGVLPERLDLRDVPHFAQARRIGKIFTHRNNPEWSGTVITNFYGLNAIGEENVHIRFPLLGIDTTFAIKSLRILDNFTGVELTLASLSAAAFEWDAELEEGSAPNTPPDTASPVPLDPPEDFNVSPAQRDLGGGGTGVFLVATWTEPTRTALGQDVEYRSVPDGTWIPMVVSDGVGLAESGLVASGVSYETRIRTRSPGGTSGDWSASVVVVATPDTSAAGVVTAVSGAGGSEALIAWTMAPENRSIGARVYRNTVNNAGTSTLIATVYGSPSTDGVYEDDPAAGTYYYWLASWTGSFVEGSKTAVGAIVVT